MNIKGILTASVFIAILGGFFMLGRIMAPPEVSDSERRPLEKLPEFTATAVTSKLYARKFELYAADSFPLREAFRYTRAAVELDILRLSDKSGVYRTPDGIGRFERLDETATRRNTRKITALAASLPESVRMYAALIPDKSIYEKKHLPGYDPAKAAAIMREEAPGLTLIDLVPALDLSCYYRTDLHWDQANIGGVLESLGKQMGFYDRLNTDFTYHNAGPFYGVFAGQLALPVQPDTMIYLTSPGIDAATVEYLTPAGEFEAGGMYSETGFAGRDPYDGFLRGAQPLIIITNKTAPPNTNLYIFRDSYTSSLAPLLTSAYSKITLIDLRYLNAAVLSSYVTFEPNSDVLFLYGPGLAGVR